MTRIPRDARLSSPAGSRSAEASPCEVIESPSGAIGIPLGDLRSSTQLTHSRLARGVSWTTDSNARDPSASACPPFQITFLSEGVKPGDAWSHPPHWLSGREGGRVSRLVLEIDLEGGGVTAVGASMSLDGGPMNLDGAPMRREGGPTWLDGGPMTLDGEPRRLVGTRTSLVGARERLDGVRSCLVGARKRLAGARKRLAGARKRLVGARSCLVRAPPSNTSRRLLASQRAIAFNLSASACANQGQLSRRNDTTHPATGLPASMRRSAWTMAAIWSDASVETRFK